MKKLWWRLVYYNCFLWSCFPKVSGVARGKVSGWVQLGGTGKYLYIMLLFPSVIMLRIHCELGKTEEWKASMPLWSVLSEIVVRQLLNQYLEEPSICAQPEECKATVEIILMTNYKVLPFFLSFSKKKSALRAVKSQARMDVFFSWNMAAVQ